MESPFFVQLEQCLCYLRNEFRAGTAAAHHFLVDESNVKLDVTLTSNYCSGALTDLESQTTRSWTGPVGPQSVDVEAVPFSSKVWKKMKNK